MRKSALYLLGLVVAALVALGLVVLFSASEVRSMRLSGTPWQFVAKQSGYIIAGLVLASVVALIDYHRWRDQWLLTALLAFFVFAALWVVFAFPAVKGFFALPVLLEPDFGSVMVIVIVGAMLMFVAGTRFLHLLPLFLAGVAVVAWEVIHNPNRMARIAAFVGVGMDGTETPADVDAAYQSGMAIVAISRGGLFGVGLGRSMQKQNYLPEAWTDFIFAIGAEELGLVFSIAVLLLFLAFFFISVHIARKSSGRLGRFMALGMAVVVFFQAMFNIGVVCKAFPTKGMALPFFSYGGTNMITTFLAVGFIFSVGLHALKDQDKPFTRKTVAN